MIPVRQIHEIVTHWARHTPAAPALRDGTRIWSYAALWQSVEGVATELAALGLCAGQRVLVVAENCPEQVVLLLAGSLADLWMIQANARLTGHELDALAQDSGAACRIYACSASDAAARHAASAHARPWAPGGLSGLALAWPTDPGIDVRPEPVAEAPGERIAALVYTTGTTGVPKGVMLRQRNLLFAASRSAQLRQLRPDDRCYGVLPFSHVYGLTSVLLATFYAGASLRVAARFSAEATWSALGSEGVTVLQGVPTLYVRLLESGMPAAHAPDLRALFSGGAPLDPGLKQRVELRFGLPLHNGYGLTECSPSICQTRLDQPRGDDAVGHPLPGLELRFVDADRKPVPPGAVGGLQVRGPGVMAGYYRAPALTATVLDADGWLDTGDLGRQDHDGAVFLLGRSTEVIIRSGFKVYPQEVELVLNRLPGVRQSAVLGRDIGHGDQEVVAFIEWQPGGAGSAEELSAAAARQLAAYKVPARWIGVAQLPLSPAGKIRKAELRRTML